LSRRPRTLWSILAYLAITALVVLVAWWPTLNRDSRGPAQALSEPTTTVAVVADSPASATLLPTEAATLAPTQTRSAPLAPSQTPEPTSTPSETLTPEPTATSVPSDTPTLTPTPSDTPTPTDTPLPTVTIPPTATPTLPIDRLKIVGETPEPHLWLDRPVSVEVRDRVDRWYPYGATGEDMYPVHHGVEFVNPTGTELYAVAPAKVEVAGSDNEGIYSYKNYFYGSLVVLKLEQRWENQPVYVLYGHLDEVLVEPGQLVDPGDLIGRIGATGVALGPHLHMEIRVGENSYWTTRNPELWLKPLPGYGTIAGRVVTQEGNLLPEALVAISKASAADQAYRQIWSYSTRDITIDEVRRLDSVNSDDAWPETWAIGDLPADTYVVGVRVNGKAYTEQVTVRDGELSYVVLVVE
jgi:murein DD-endopeptidase MepM/ murein hydrolase activator NlpD